MDGMAGSLEVSKHVRINVTRLEIRDTVFDRQFRIIANNYVAVRFEGR